MSDRHAAEGNLALVSAAYIVAAAVGVGWWVLFTWLAEGREAWDSGLYFPGLVGLLGLSVLLGRTFPRHALGLGAALGIGHVVTALVFLRGTPPGPGVVFWPVVLGLFGLLGVGTTVAAWVGGKKGLAGGARGGK